MKGTTRSIVLIAIAVGAFAMPPPSTWREFEDAVRGHVNAPEEIIGPTAEQEADWLAEGEGRSVTHSGAGSSGATGTGPARVVDGDTLEVRGTRIRARAWSGGPPRRRRV